MNNARACMPALKRDLARLDPFISAVKEAQGQDRSRSGAKGKDSHESGPPKRFLKLPLAECASQCSGFASSARRPEFSYEKSVLSIYPSVSPATPFALHHRSRFLVAPLSGTTDLSTRGTTYTRVCTQKCIRSRRRSGFRCLYASPAVKTHSRRAGVSRRMPATTYGRE